LYEKVHWGGLNCKKGWSFPSPPLLPFFVLPTITHRIFDGKWMELERRTKREGKRNGEGNVALFNRLSPPKLPIYITKKKWSEG
jgi:hypothetical protein